MADAKCLHWSFFVKNRIAEIAFYKEILGMKVLKHHEFEEKGSHPPPLKCQRMWSATLFSYGDEFRSFGLQLIYSYDPKIDSVRGNDFTAITIQSEQVLDRAEAADYPITEVKNGAYKVITSPNGYPFLILDKPEPHHDLILKIHLTCTDELNVLLYWHCILGAKYLSHHLGHSVVMSFQDYGVKFKFRKTDEVRLSSHGCRLTCATTVEKIKNMEQFLTDEGLEISLPLTPLDITDTGQVLAMIVTDFNENPALRKKALNSSKVAHKEAVNYIFLQANKLLDGHEIALVDEVEYERLPEDNQVEGLLMLNLRKELIYRGEKPILDQIDVGFHKFLEYFGANEQCQRRHSFRVLGPLES